MAILYFWIQSIYNSAGQSATTIINELRNTLNDTIKAGQEGLCCLGGTCGACISYVT